MTDSSAATPHAVWRAGCPRSPTEAADFGVRHDFAAGELVCSLTPMRNGGRYPHRDMGEMSVSGDDTGHVHQRWSFLEDIYYAVEFVDRAVAVLTRGRELAEIDGNCRAANTSRRPETVAAL